MQRRTKIFLAVGVGVFAFFCVVATVLAVSVASFISTDPTEPMDKMFGDQYLKTSVALIELHNLRCGRYPETLNHLDYTGAWDVNALQSVEYTPNADRTVYYVEVECGWVRKPELGMPPGFWRGTGYREGLNPDR